MVHVTGNAEHMIEVPKVMNMLEAQKSLKPKKIIMQAVTSALATAIPASMTANWKVVHRAGLVGRSKDSKGTRVFRGVQWRAGVQAGLGPLQFLATPQVEFDSTEIIDALAKRLPGVELYANAAEEKTWAKVLSRLFECFCERADGLEYTYLKHCWAESLTAVRSAGGDDASCPPLAAATFCVVAPRQHGVVKGDSVALEDRLADARYGPVVYFQLILARAKGEGRRLVNDVFAALQRTLLPPPLRIAVNPPPKSEQLKAVYESANWGLLPFKDGYYISPERRPPQLSGTEAAAAVEAAAAEDAAQQYSVMARTYHRDLFINRTPALFQRALKAWNARRTEQAAAAATQADVSSALVGKKRRRKQ